MAQLREHATPLGLKAKDAFTLQIGLAHHGIGPKQILHAFNPLSPTGAKAKDKSVLLSGMGGTKLFS